ncbi:ScbA/BarX family gamma-butyrolactone biosynthesis protein [Streptomyces sp. K1PA1]|uniref:ScbA/BarX family gamma-butyrolactone biosynthesis protein n=2 Tax=Streptomyces tropicalis TaxID=3034234 RepID=A0ABT6A1I0_9ACTN|nr:ScbA/BarX family gamma-butyrolactone biosynthesis protein [Streptomyces tropicalis]
MTATVPRELVHRAALSETFLTGWTRTGEDRFTVSAQWPRAHPLHVSPDRSAHDPLLVVETVRQSGTLLAHTEYGVPLGHQFVLQELHVTTEPKHLAVGPAPAETDLEVSFSRAGSGRSTALRYEVEVWRDDRRAATARVSFTSVGAAAYRRLRGGRTPGSVSALPVPSGVEAAAVHRTLDADVVLAPTRRRDRWQLRVDTAHPVFFDHPLDHVPGMLLLEGARQAACLLGASTRPPTSFQASFHRYAELDRPTWIQAEAASGGELHLVGIQGESTVFACRVDAAVW